MEGKAMVGMQILVVEDNELQSKFVRFLLEEAVHRVRVAESAEQAQQVLETFVPDLILMDLQLPGKDGLELTRELRLNPVYDKTPIVALTAYTGPSDLAKAREAGCSGTISKPIDTAAFERQVRNYLGRTEGADEDVPSDSGDFLTELRNNFLAEGLEQCGALLNEFQTNPSRAIAAALRVIHRWAGVGGTLGFLEISKHARKIEDLLSSTGPDYLEAVKGIETARRRFCAATRHEPGLPVELIRGLMDVRIGLVNFSNQEADRIRTAAKRASVEVAIEQIDGESIENPTGYGALIVNQCALSAQAAPRRPAWPIPAVFIVSRASLESLARLPAWAYDFLIAPWEAEEILMRVHRLIAKTALTQPTGDSLHMPRRRPRVLIADDDPELVSLVWETLGQFGMDCDIARSGRQALDTAGRHPLPDAIVLDVNMVDLDGFEILKKLRHNLATKAIPVLLLTARNQQSDIATGFGSGADDYVIKPFQPSDLARRVEQAIAARKAHAAR